MQTTEVRFPPKLKPLFTPSRYKFIRGGRGSGKSWGAARALLVKAASQRTRVLCAREVQKSLKESVHQLLRDQIERLNLGAFFTILETEIRGANGSLFTFTGLSDKTAESIKSYEGYDLVWLEEAQAISKRSWSILTPTIRKPGSEIWATFNPDLETDETYRMAVLEPPPNTISIEINWIDNPDFPEVLEQERQHALKTMKPSEYAHIWEGQCRPAVEGAIYYDEVSKVERTGRIVHMTADPLLKAHAIWDLGWNDSMAIILAQRVASEVRVIDYIEDSHRALPDYVRELQAMPITNWGNDWLPHDGYATRHQTGKSDEQVLLGLNRQPQMVPNVEVEQGIRTARIVFPRVWFADTERVARLIECLKRYRRNVSTTTGEPGAPRHDEYSHGADAFRYLCLVADQMTNTVRAPRAPRSPGMFVG